MQLARGHQGEEGQNSGREREEAVLRWPGDVLTCPCFQLFGEGLHRKLSIDTHLASVNRFSDCRLLYELTIPAGAYIDSDTWAVRFLGIREFRANASLPGHVVHARHRFDVEAPRERSDSQKVCPLPLSSSIPPLQIWLLSNIQTRKSFVIEEKFHLAVHIRYHRAVEG